jgi:hypothetical protein
VNAFDGIAVVLRGCGESTESLAEQALVACGVPPGSVVRTGGGPFERTLRETFELGLDSGQPLTLSIDADVLVSPSRLPAFLAEVEFGRHSFSVQGSVLCKFFGGPRLAGNRLYRNAHAAAALRLLPEVRGTLRPEAALVALMAQRGVGSQRSNVVLGLHDYGQHPRDVFRKAAVQSRKHLYLASYLLPFWRDRAALDREFAIALRGFGWGLALPGPDGLDDLYAALSAVHETEWDVHGPGHGQAAESVRLADIDPLMAGWRPSREFVRWFPERVSLRTARRDPASRGVRATLGWGARRIARRI